VSLCSPEFDPERETRPPLDLAFTGLLIFVFVTGDCRGDLWSADASPVPIGGMRTESKLGSGVVGRDFDDNFCRGAFDDRLPRREPVAIGAIFFLVGGGTSSSDVSGSILGRRLLVDEGTLCVRWGGGIACRDGEGPSLARPEDLPVRLGLRFCADTRVTAGSSICI
jgi:hypothetical protein